MIVSAWWLVVWASVSAHASTMNSSGTQMPSLRPLSTLSPWRMRIGRRGSVTTALASGAAGGAGEEGGEEDGGQQGLRDRQRGEQRLGEERSERDRQRQSDAEKPRRHAALAAQDADVDPGGVGEQDEGERRLREGADRRIGRRVGDEVEDLR